MAREIDESWIDEAIARYRRIDELRTEFDKAVTEQVVTVHSPDSTVEVKVTAAGEIIDVRISGSLRDRDSAELSRQVRTVVTGAAEAARWAREKLHGEVFGEFRRLDAR